MLGSLEVVSLGSTPCLIPLRQRLKQLVSAIDNKLIFLFALAVGDLEHEPLSTDCQVVLLAEDAFVHFYGDADVLLRLGESVLLFHDGGDLEGRVGDDGARRVAAGVLGIVSSLGRFVIASISLVVRLKNHEGLFEML